MEICLGDMDIRPIYAGEMQRQKRSVFPVHTMGLAVGKRAWVDHSFATINFSLILAGGGMFFDRGREHRVEAPCVITQWPGEAVRYGPTEDWETWDELYITFHGSRRPFLEAALLCERPYPVWNFEATGAFGEALERLAGITREPVTPGWVERFDLACEALIMETRPSTQPLEAPELVRLAGLRSQVDRDFLEIESMDVFAKAHGYSRSAFRRLWGRISELPPQRYLNAAKLKHACRLLVETHLTVGEIADRIGFRDRLYFSRKFRQQFGLTASEYRRRNQQR